MTIQPSDHHERVTTSVEEYCRRQETLRKIREELKLARAAGKAIRHRNRLRLLAQHERERSTHAQTPQTPTVA